MAARIELIISGDNTGAVNALRGLANVVINVNNTINNANHNINNFNNQINNFGDGLRNGQSSSNGLMSSLSRLTMVAAGVVGVLYTIKEALETIVVPGFDFSKEMEMNELGIAGIIQSMTLLNGKAVAFGEAMQISDDIVAKLQKDAIRTGATMKELVTVYRAILAPGIGAGMNLDEIQKITTMGANAVKAIMPGNGQAQIQMVQELRDLVQGGIQASSSTLATSLGITDADIKRAKNSTEGLFKFLMDRLEGFQDVSKAFPDTMQGKMDNLAEVATIASSKITKEFEGDFKDILTYLTGLLGELDTKTGELNLNPALLQAIKDVKNEFKDWSDILKNMAGDTSWVNDIFIPSLVNIYKAIKNIVSAVVDLNNILKQGAITNFFMQGLKDLTEDILTLSNIIAEFFDDISRKTGTKKITDTQTRSPADLKRSEDSNDTPNVVPIDTSKLTPKFGNPQKDIERSQEALKIAEAQIKADAEIAKVQIKEELKKLEVLNQQNLISAAAYASQRAELEYKEQQVDQERIQRILEVVNGSLFTTDKSKNEKQSALGEELRVATERLKSFGDALADINNAAGIAEVGTNQLGEIIIEAGEKQLGLAYLLGGDGITSTDCGKFVQDTLIKAGVEVGSRTADAQFLELESAGKTFNDRSKLNKGDLVFWHTTDRWQTSEDPNAVNDPNKAYKGVTHVGIYANDNKVLQAGSSGVSYQDMDAFGPIIGFGSIGDKVKTFSAQAKTKFSTILTKSGLEYYKAILELYDQADDMSKKLAETHGDISSRQKAELSAKYDAQIKKFKLNGMDSFADIAQKLKESEFAKLDFAQSQKNIDIANGELITTQKNLINDLAKETKSAVAVTQEYTDTYNAKVKAEVTKLEQQLANAVLNEDKDLANHIRAELRKIPEAINEFAEKVIQQINTQLQNDINSINADRSLTSMQKKDAIEARQRKAYGELADDYETRAKNLRGMSDKKKAELKEQGIDPDVTAATLEQQAALNRKYEELPSLLDKIHESSKQAFEDGLLDFLSRGIIECKNLGEAFRNLAISVLQSIQKIYAEAMTKNIMSSLGFGAKPSPPAAQKNAEGGHIQGPGTGTSDSILSWLSNGEFVVKASSVQKYGTNFLHSLNNGFLPKNLMPRYATGGLVGASIEGATGIASSIQGGDVTVPLKVVNVTDPNEVGRYLMTRSGERVMVNFMKNNAGTMRQILNIRG